MATTRSAHTIWEGDLITGSGRTSLDSSGLGTFDVTWKARAEQAEGKTSPEELIGAAHSACFSMAFSGALKKAGYTAERLETSAEVDFQPGEGITEIRLSVNAFIPHITVDEFNTIAADAKENCPVSQALAAVKSIQLHATLAAV